MQRRGKAPPIDSFTREDNEIRFDDWLPTLERAAAWNDWTEDEKVIQLAGYLRGRALQEWNLITTTDCTTYQSAVVALRTRQHSWTLAIRHWQLWILDTLSKRKLRVSQIS